MTSRRRLRVAGDPDLKARPGAVAATDRMQAVIHVRPAPAASRRGFEQYLLTLPPGLRAWQVTGDVDYELLVACPAIADFDGVLTCLRRCGGPEVTSVGLARISTLRICPPVWLVPRQPTFALLVCLLRKEEVA